MYQFLMRLNDEIYGTVRSTITQQEPLPTLKQVVARIYKEEQHKNLIRTVAAEERGTTEWPL